MTRAPSTCCCAWDLRGGPGAVCHLTERRWRVEARRDDEGSPRLGLGLYPAR
ncbi:hypothetical protein [Rubrobacter marinus]|uniref:hypothetical protein n=1 Tax=Rubrobacter marinus TaxID=2653852 RepID=UPI001A9D6646|nr:hypothetical protein [Rubrobacter marinus]